MNTRRAFFKQAGLLGGAGAWMLSDSIRRAFAIDPAPGTTFLDAEHVVILMQENRSFDHVYGSLRGVRGFNDPRAMQLPNGNPVWLQSNDRGETFAPFRLDIKETKVTWLGSLPHSWTDQVDARNSGKYDRWLEAKKSSHKECVGMPFTMGSYVREDLPFYYDLADAFTVCDQNFCSSLTGTMANRLYFWTGTIRGADATARARLNNGDTEYENSCRWTTFPGRLEDLGVSWNVYQNEISSVEVGFKGEEGAWLANFGDNPLEWFPQHHAGFSSGRQKFLAALTADLPGEIETLKTKAQAPGQTAAELATATKNLEKVEALLKAALAQKEKWSPENFAKLSPREKNLHTKACSINDHDPDFHELALLKYRDGDIERTMEIPKGDVLRRFREDVGQGKLPTVSWLVPPENFSDHPGAAWYGAWYVSEVMNILTQNPAIWKKTIFILAYDENDGYFDHVPPFVAPHPRKPETGATSAGSRSEEDFVTMEEELKVKDARRARESSIGLGYRVPLVIASPWSRGGYVCSQVFDHTSTLQFLEKFLSHKLGKPVTEPNISAWRRAVCGDLTSSFRPYNGEAIVNPPFLAKEPFVAGIHKAQFKPGLRGFKALTKAQIDRAREGAPLRELMLQQEAGTRPSCALPYQLSADGRWNPETKSFEISFASLKNDFGAKAAGSAFNVYAPGKFRAEACRSWAFAVAAGENVKYSWPVADFEDGKVFLRVYGPNGFFREFRGGAQNFPIDIQCASERGETSLRITNLLSDAPRRVEIIGHAYNGGKRIENIPPGAERLVKFDTTSARGWHDISVRVEGDPVFEARFAGRAESGEESISDPLMGGSA